MKAPDVEPGGRGAGGPPSLTGSLLLRLQEAVPQAWERLTQLYGPQVYSWCRRKGLSPEDAADLGQEVFQAVARAIHDFRRDRPGDSFRGWLWTVTHNKIRDHWRRQAEQAPAVGGSTFQRQLAEVPAPESLADDSGPTSTDAQDLYRRALALIQTDFEERTWQAFWRVAVDGQTAGDVAAELGISKGAVYIAKSRVLRRLQDEFGELM